MSFWKNWFVEVKRGSKITYSPSDLNKLDRTYEREVFEQTKRKVMSPFRKEPQRSFTAQVRDYAFEQILDRRLYTFAHILVIPNPYGLAQQTALLLFNSSKEYRVRYCVQGDDGADFVAETEPAKRHRVAVLGLYLNRSNKVDLYLVDENDEIVKHRMIRIYVPDAPINSQGIVTKVERKPEMPMPMMMVNGVTFKPMALDGNGAIRYALQLRTNRMGMIPLQNGHFLFADRTASCVNSLGKVQPCRYHEMDYLGRVYRTFIIKEPISPIVAQNEDSLYLATASDIEHSNDCIMELDMNHGEIVRKIDLAQILGSRYRDVSDWTKLSYMEYHDGCLLLTCRRLHTVLCLELDTLQPRFILAATGVWDGTELEKYVLQPEPGTKFPMGWPCSAVWTGDNTMLVFNGRAKGDLEQGYSDLEHSEVAEIVWNPEQNSYCCRYSHQSDRTLTYGTAMQLQDRKMVYLQGSVQKKTDDRRSVLTVVDQKQDREGSRITLSKAYINAWEFQPDIASFSRIIDVREQCIFGSLNMPKVFTGTLPELTTEKVPKTFFRRPHLCDNLFLFSMLPGSLARIYFVGKDHAYVEDYSQLEEGSRQEVFAIQVDGFEPDEYFIYLEFDGIASRLKNEIRILP